MRSYCERRPVRAVSPGDPAALVSPKCATCTGHITRSPKKTEYCMTAPALTFLAPPSFADDDAPDATAAPYAPPDRTGHDRSDAAPGRRAEPAGVLRMTRGARAAASGMNISDGDIRRCLDAPDDASPDPNTPSRTRFRRDSLVVVAGADGMVLRVNRTGPDRAARSGGTSRPARRRRGRSSG